MKNLTFARGLSAFFAIALAINVVGGSAGAAFESLDSITADDLNAIVNDTAAAQSTAAAAQDTANTAVSDAAAAQSTADAALPAASLAASETDPTVPASIKDGIDWSELTGIPADFADGVDNNDAKLTEAEVDAYTANNGYLTTETDPTVNAAAKADLSTCAAGDVLLLGSSGWECSSEVSGAGKWSDGATSGDIVYTGGNVGIGTDSPTSLLHVAGAHGVILSAGDPNNWENNTVIQTGWESGVGDFTDIKVPGSVDRGGFLRVNSEGNVGIGATAPSAALHVSSGEKTASNILAKFSTTEEEGGQLFYIENVDNTGINIQSTENNIGNNNLVLNRYGGNVGIGTTDPDAKLEVAGLVQANAGSELGWNSFGLDYFHDSNTGKTHHYWNRIGRVGKDGASNSITFEIILKHDVNYPHHGRFLLIASGFSGHSYSVALSGNNAFDYLLEAGIDEEGYVWVRPFATWTHHSSWRVLYNRNGAEVLKDGVYQEEDPAGFVQVRAGEAKRATHDGSNITEVTHQYSGIYGSHGTVGIGTQSPDAKLDINGTTHLRNSLTIDSFIASTYLPTINQAKYLELFSVDGTNYLAAAGLPAYQDDKIVDATDIYIYSYSESDFEDFELVSTLVPGSAINSIKPFQIDGTTYLAVAMEGNSQSKIYQWSSGAFVDIANNNGTLSFETSDIEPFTTEDGNAYIAVADTTDSQTRIQIWNGSNFSKTELWSFTGLTDTADIQYIKIGDREFLAFADNADADQSFRLFEYSNGQFDFSAPIQTLARTNLNRIQTFVHNNATYIALSHEHIVEMLQWDDETSSFQTFQGFYTTEQTSNTSEASGALYFTRGSEEYLLALSNTAESKLHRWNGSQFEFIQNFSVGADDTLDAVVVNGGNTFLLAYASNGSSTGSSIRKHHWNTNFLVTPGYGRVGIGTNDPKAALDVQSGEKTSSNILAKFSTTDENAQLFYIENINNAGINIQSTENGIASNDLVLNRYGGNVGIGTQSPDAKLEVHAGSNVLENVVDGALLNINQAYPGGGTATAADYKDASITLGVNVSHGKISAGGSFSDNDPGHLSLFTRNATSKELEEAMRIDHNGNVGIGTTEPRAKLEITSDGEEDNDLLIHSKTTGAVGSPADWARISLMREGETDEGFLGFYGTNLSGGSSGLMLGVSGEHVIRFNTNGGDKMFIYPNGDVGIAGTVTAGGETLDSDIRYKKDIQTLPSALKNILSLRGVSYYWKDRNDNTQQIGVIAQEVEKIYPQLVHTNEDGYKSVAYANLVSPLIEAVKELHALYQGHADRIAALEEQIQQLQERYEDIEARLTALEAAQ